MCKARVAVGLRRRLPIARDVRLLACQGTQTDASTHERRHTGLLGVRGGVKGNVDGRHGTDGPTDTLKSEDGGVVGPVPDRSLEGEEGGVANIGSGN